MHRYPKVVYLLWRFPVLTETFILREMVYLRRLGMDVQVFSMLHPFTTSTMHQQVQEMMPFVHYSPSIFSVKLLLAQANFFLRSPTKYIRAFFKLLWQTLPEPFTIIKALTIFPKAVFFAAQMEEMKIDHIHAHFVWLNGVAAQVARDLIGVTYSLHAHAWDIFSRDHECVRRQLELATSIITVSEYHRQFLTELCPSCHLSNIQVVHYGLDPAEFIPSHMAEEDNCVRIVSVGSLFEKKGHEYLIDACAELATRSNSFRCAIVGSGPLQDSLQERIDNLGLRDLISLLGPKNQAQIRKLYQQSDIFVLACVIAKSGDIDGMPNVLLEAMAMEIPVVTTPVTGNPELVHNEVNGLLVPERDSHALAIALERLIYEPSLRIKLGKQGRRTVREGFDIHQTAAQMACIFQDIYQRHN